MVRWQRPDSELFEEVFFVLKDETSPLRHGDIVAEATRILSESVTGRPAPKRDRGRLLFFFLGAALSAALLLPVLLL